MTATSRTFVAKVALGHLAIFAALALLAGVVGVWGGARFLTPETSQSPSMHMVLHEELDLSPQQERRLEAVEARFAPRRATLERELRAANLELAQAMRAGRYGPEVQLAIDHFHMAMGGLQKETVLHLFEMRALLTPEQAAVFDQRIGEALTEDHP